MIERHILVLHVLHNVSVYCFGFVLAFHKYKMIEKQLFVVTVLFVLSFWEGIKHNECL